MERTRRDVRNVDASFLKSAPSDDDPSSCRAYRLHINLFPPSTSPLGVNGQFKFVSSRNFTRETPLSFFFLPLFFLDRKWSIARRFEHLHENVTRVSRALLDTNFCIMRWIRLESSRKFLSRFWFWQFHGCAEFANTGSGKETCNGISLYLFDRASINAKSLVRGYFLLPLYIRFCNAAADAGYQIFFLSRFLSKFFN